MYYYLKQNWIKEYCPVCQEDQILPLWSKTHIQITQDEYFIFKENPWILE